MTGHELLESLALGIVDPSCDPAAACASPEFVPDPCTEAEADGHDPRAGQRTEHRACTHGDDRRRHGQDEVTREQSDQNRCEHGAGRSPLEQAGAVRLDRIAPNDEGHHDGGEQREAEQDGRAAHAYGGSRTEAGVVQPDASVAQRSDHTASSLPPGSVK